MEDLVKRLVSRVAAGVVVFLFSCEEKVNTPVPQIRIDNISSSGQSKISVIVDITGPLSSVLEKGIFWDTIPNLKINKNKRINTEAGNQFTDTAEGLRHSTRYYVQAYLAFAKDTIYSNVATTTTNTVITLFDKKFPPDQNSPSIVDVVGNEQEGFTICFSMVRPGIGPGIGLGFFLRLMKVDGGGNLIWKRDYDDGTSKESRTITKLADGYLVGSTYWTNGSASLILRKIDVNGNLLWGREFKKDVYQFPIRVSLRKDVFLVTMRSYNYAPLDEPRRSVSLWDFAVDNNGNVVTEKEYPNFSLLDGVNINYNPLETSDQGFFYYSNFGLSAQNSDVMNFLFDGQNSRKWKKIYETPLIEQPVKATIGLNGNFVVTGYQWNAPLWSTRRFVYEFSRDNGELVWQKFYDDFFLSRYASAYEIVASNGAYYLGGGAYFGNAPNAKMILSKLDANGNVDWEYFIVAKDNNFAHIDKIYVAGTNDIYVFGRRSYARNTSPYEICILRIKA